MGNQLSLSLEQPGTVAVLMPKRKKENKSRCNRRLKLQKDRAKSGGKLNVDRENSFDNKRLEKL